MVVIWTQAAAESDWVKSEAGRANSASKLVNVRSTDTPWCDVPSPYDQHHVNDLDDHPGILRSIEAVRAGRPVRTAVPLHEFYYRQHGHRLIDPKQAKLARDPREIGPTDLLQAKHGVVDDLDVTGLRADLIDWSHNLSRKVAGRLIHRPGGLGKSRLMIEIAARLREHNWMAGFLERPRERDANTIKQRLQAFEQLIAHGEDKGLLIVMDYAEGRQDEVERITQQLCRRAETNTRPIRFVLLARSAGEWWATLHDDTPEVQRIFRGTGIEPDVIELPAIATDQQRLDLFETSLAAFAPLLTAQGYATPKDPPSAKLLQQIGTDSGYTRPLAVQMEALLWLALAAPEAGTATVDALLHRALGLERSHWKKLIGALDEDGTRDLARGAAQVTVVREVRSRASAEQLLTADGFYAGQRTARVMVDPVFRNLSRVYSMPNAELLTCAV